MQTRLAAKIQQDKHGPEIESILRKCVHCGFCNATCPTYQLRGDELDGPRGRIYQMKQFFEGEPANAEMLKHLDRCLTCRACETTCPSGVKYSHLLEIGKQAIERELPRPLWGRMRRWGILLDSLIWFMGLISLQLGIFNLLPIPILDGGHLTIIGFESIIRRDLSIKVKERILEVGFYALILLMVVVLFNDIVKVLPNSIYNFFFSS